jgi:hypothetical protein
MASKWFPLVGLGFAVSGADKILGLGGYERLFADLGWSQTARKLLGAAEFLGGVMISSTYRRMLGGLVLVGASSAMLTAEVRRNQSDLALPRLLVLLAAATALIPFPSRPARRAVPTKQVRSP